MKAEVAGEALADLWRLKWGRLKIPAGMVVVRLMPQSPLGSAGITNADIITMINGIVVRDDASWIQALSTIRFDSKTSIMIMRGDGKKATTRRIDVSIPGLEKDEARAAQLLVNFEIDHDPAMGRCYIKRVFLADDGFGVLTSKALSLTPYIDLTEKGNVSFRLTVLYLGEESLLIRQLHLRAGETATELELPKATREIKEGYVKERCDREIEESVLERLANAATAYATVLGAHDRFSCELSKGQQTDLKELLEYASLIRKLGPVRARAVPKPRE